MTESIRELDERIFGLIESLSSVDMDEEDLARQFVEVKFVGLSLHAHVEQEKIKSGKSSEQIKYKKQLNLYQSIDSILAGKCNELSLTEMVDKLHKCKELVAQNL